MKKRILIKVSKVEMLEDRKLSNIFLQMPLHEPVNSWCKSKISPILDYRNQQVKTVKVVAEVVGINIRETHQLLHLQLNLILHRRTNSNLNLNKLVELWINKNNQNRLTKQISYHNNHLYNKIAQEIIPRFFRARDRFKVRSHYQKSSVQIQQVIIQLL